MKPAIRIGVVGVGAIAQIAHIPVLASLGSALLEPLREE
jgi:predicted dehydrogenase